MERYRSVVPQACMLITRVVRLTVQICYSYRSAVIQGKPSRTELSIRMDRILIAGNCDRWQENRVKVPELCQMTDHKADDAGLGLPSF